MFYLGGLRDDRTLARSDKTHLLAHPVQQNTRWRHRAFCSRWLGPAWIKQSMGLNSSPSLQGTCHAMCGQNERVARRRANLRVPANDNLCILAGRCKLRALDWRAGSIFNICDMPTVELKPTPLNLHAALRARGRGASAWATPAAETALITLHSEGRVGRRARPSWNNVRWGF